eukprot:COSAG02_NODE_6812_length_3348_cov_16.189905_2_plen_94_part_00
MAKTKLSYKCMEQGITTWQALATACLPHAIRMRLMDGLTAKLQEQVEEAINEGCAKFAEEWTRCCIHSIQHSTFAAWNLSCKRVLIVIATATL